MVVAISGSFRLIVSITVIQVRRLQKNHALVLGYNIGLYRRGFWNHNSITAARIVKFEVSNERYFHVDLSICLIIRINNLSRAQSAI